MISAEGAVVAAGDHFVSYPEPLAPDVECATCGIEFPGVEADALGELVEVSDGVGAVGHLRHCFAAVAGSLPCVDDLGFHLFVGSAVEAALSFVFGEDGGVAGSETEAGGAFPFVGEAVDLVEFCRPVEVDEMGEHASPADRSELAGVADEDDAPVVLVGETGKGCQFGGGGGCGLVDNQRGVGAEGVARVRWSVGLGVFGEELVQRVGRQVCFGAEDLGGGGGGS